MGNHNNRKNIIKELEKQKQELKDKLRKKNTEISNLENKIDVLEDKHQKYKDNISNIFENNLYS